MDIEAPFVDKPSKPHLCVPVNPQTLDSERVWALEPTPVSPQPAGNGSQFRRGLPRAQRVSYPSAQSSRAVGAHPHGLRYRWSISAQVALSSLVYPKAPPEHEALIRAAPENSPLHEDHVGLAGAGHKEGALLDLPAVAVFGAMVTGRLTTRRHG